MQDGRIDHIKILMVMTADGGDDDDGDDDKIELAGDLSPL